MIVWHVILLIAGIALICYAGTIFVDGSVALAEIFHCSKLIIGVVILGFGTSAPEIAVSLISAWQGHASIVTGNILGSNVTNVLLILGLSLFVNPGKKPFNIPWLYSVSVIIAAVLFLYGLWMGNFSQIFGLILLMLAIIFAIAMVYIEKESMDSNVPANVVHHHNLWWISVKTLLGLGLLIGSSEMIIFGAVEISQHIGLSQTVIAATIIAAGTSLPELALSIAAAKKNHFELVLGNVIGSNVINVFMGIGLAATVAPWHQINSIGLIYTTFFGFCTVGLILLSHVDGLRRRSMGVIFLFSYATFLISSVWGN